MADFKELRVWRLALDVAKSVYCVTKSFPDHEKYGLISQMRRAAVSIMSNIAEGSKRGGRDQVYFLRIAQGSAAELESQLILAQEIGFIVNLHSPIFDELDHMSSVLCLYRRHVECHINNPRQTA